jgi:hypothetical protein
MEQSINRKPPRIRRSKAEIANLLGEFEKINASVKDFCLLHNISRTTFQKWQSRYKTKSVQQVSSSGFAELQISGHETVKPDLFAEIRVIKIYQPVTAVYLKELLP